MTESTPYRNVAALCGVAGNACRHNINLARKFPMNARDERREMRSRSLIYQECESAASGLSSIANARNGSTAGSSSLTTPLLELRTANVRSYRSANP